MASASFQQPLATDTSRLILKLLMRHQKKRTRDLREAFTQPIGDQSLTGGIRTPLRKPESPSGACGSMIS